MHGHDRHGVYMNLMQELRTSDVASYQNFFRMSPENFAEIDRRIQPLIQREDTNFHKAVSPEERLAVTVQYLATGESFKSLSYSFRLGATTIGEIVPDTCNAMYEVLKDDYLKLPQAQDEWTQIVNVLFERWHFPHTVGAIDGKHIALWAPAKSRSLVFVAHGAIEHCLLYETLASTLATHGCLVFAHDHAGSGQSEGPGLYADNFQHYVDDVFGHVDKIRKLHPDVPVFCIGQSMGGMITLTAALQKPSYFCGIVLTAPGIIPAQGPPSFFSALVLKTLSWLRPQMDLLQTSLGGVTRNQDAKDRLAKDPLVFHGSLKARWVATVMNAMRNLESKLSEVNTPFLVLHGNADPTASIEGSRKLHELAKTTDKTIKEYADCLHRLYDEPDGVGEAVHREIVEWIIKRC